MNKAVHHGRNVKRFREMLSIKQETFAHNLGGDWNQKKISILEGKEVIDDTLLEQIAQTLKVPAEAIKNFDEEKAIINIQNNYEGANAVANGVTTQNNSDCTFNTSDKLIEVMEEYKNLYTALIKEKDEKIALLEKMLEMKK